LYQLKKAHPMSSILTNTGAQTALATLKSINNQLGDTQASIATGRAVSSSRDNAAVWAISKVMESDVSGFKAVSDSLSLGKATVSVARQASETVTDLLSDVKSKIVSAQGENVERSKIQADIEALTEQVKAVVGAASFNGANLLQNKESTAGSGSTEILASLDRSDSGVASSNITVKKNDLGTEAADIKATGGTFDAAADQVTLDGTQTGTIDLSSVNLDVGAVYSVNVYGTDANNSSFTQADLRSSAGSAQTQAELAASDMAYVVREGDTAADVARGLARQFSAYAAENDISSDALSIKASGSGLTVTSSVTDSTDTIDVSLTSLTAAAGSKAGGGLAALGEIDVSTADGAKSALAQIDGLMQTAIEASASFGSAEGRLETQSDFVSKLSSAMQSGIGAMVDADMEEESAKLQALQVQQQLATQALSIANRQPQALLSLFR
jgi:flagellin